MEHGGVLETMVLFCACSVSLELDGRRGLHVWEHRPRMEAGAVWSLTYIQFSHKYC